MNTNYKNLKVWIKSVDFVKNVYGLTSEFPDEEKFGLVSQIRRASVSISSNIAEGAGRNGSGEFRQFLYISKGSCLEVETQLIISNKLGFLAEEILQEVIIELKEIIKMLQGLINSLD